MNGKLIKFSSKDEVMWTLALNERDMEILKDVLEAHIESLQDALNDCAVNNTTQVQYEDDIKRISKMLGLIYMEVEDETN